jgi:hypothetical protein
MSRKPIIKIAPVKALEKPTRNTPIKDKYNLVSLRSVKPFGVESSNAK